MARVLYLHRHEEVHWLLVVACLLLERLFYRIGVDMHIFGMLGLRLWELGVQLVPIAFVAL